jgi:CDP-paratose 2-epimerase
MMIMRVALITGAGGLVGSEAVSFFHNRFDRVVGVDNDMRGKFFGPTASVAWMIERRSQQFARYDHRDVDIRDRDSLSSVFAEYGSDVALIVQAAAQPSHDWSSGDPETDFAINATGTLNLLEATRKHCSDAVFIYLSTNKVYGDNPNRLPLVEREQRWEVSPEHRYYERGIDESLNLDQTMHTIFGVSKLAGDIMCQEYGKYFGMKVGVFRGGCLTGPNHSGAQLHGFLS